MKLPAGFKDWRTTLIGTAKLINGVVPAVEIYRTAAAGFLSPEEVRHLSMHLAIFMLINALLQQLSGILTPSTAKVITKTHEITDAKIEQRDR